MNRREELIAALSEIEHDIRRNIFVAGHDRLLSRRDVLQAELDALPKYDDSSVAMHVYQMCCPICREAVQLVDKYEATVTMRREAEYCMEVLSESVRDTVFVCRQGHRFVLMSDDPDAWVE